MFRNQYDTDVTTWSPQGRLHQVEYAMEAVKQGSACVGVRSRTHAVLVALKRAHNDMSSYQKKIFKVDEHVGIAISGLTADARSLCKLMRTECLEHHYVYESPMPVQRLVLMVADKCQICTQRASARPYGVGLLVAGSDQTGPHIYYNCPSGNYYEYKAMTIGARSQAAKTYLEKNFQSFEDADLNTLVKHALTALKESSQNGEINSKNTSISIVGPDHPFKVFDSEDVQPFVDLVDKDEISEASAAAPAPAAAEGMQE
uniref:Proteasome subunit alpha type n=1 Tax=Cryptomonas curvata TaxID=233186 RepID=A0A7S0MLE9_9CRYP|mmetsp:Transcript_44303/g.92642  ORF Transcript_44303/g.92642 Transcript_44303/m.92642 type:complete len:259 (+) Transcript_44303:218-994(+)|eukprot:CAMPEP_0172175106 /NCGR_PEP_ID=MMETSP1050-20130122/14035_1 /TAXON_ID=233186 /ORGANISM="Cryptomonas curvata, Strain CCAP979/52" /LENGTH=258 /DNA_ID=CAMNT_0012847155 /DNA_START=218 /DNA_END=994 /DNA_ORIENTATION=-